MQFHKDIFWIRFKTISSWCFKLLGVIAFCLFLLSFSDIPYYAYRNLSMEDVQLKSDPKYIVMLGGSGMPSPDGFIRCYYTAQNALHFSGAKIILAHPGNGADSTKQLKLMAHELIIRGVDSSRISFEPNGFNTHTQAENICALIGKENLTAPVLLISSPEHMCRALKSFQKQGFVSIGTAPAFDSPLSETQIKNKSKTGKNQVKNSDLRYNLWSYLHYELLVLREYCALAYYKVQGWI